MKGMIMENVIVLLSLSIVLVSLYLVNRFTDTMIKKKK
jgi:hypothetical protein